MPNTIPPPPIPQVFDDCDETEADKTGIRKSALPSPPMANPDSKPNASVPETQSERPVSRLQPRRPSTPIRSNIDPDKIVQRNADPETLIHAREDLTIVNAIVAKMKPPLDKIWCLKNIEGYTCPEIAKELNSIPLWSARDLIEKANRAYLESKAAYDAARAREQYEKRQRFSQTKRQPNKEGDK